MDWDSWLPLLVLSSSFFAAVLIFPLREEQSRARTALNLAGAIVKLILVTIMFWGVFHDRSYETRFAFVPGLDLVLRVDPISLLFVSLSAGLWLVTTIYAVGYLDLEGSLHRSRFFGFFSLCVTATMGIALAGNLITFLIFYEMLTLATYPLVVHREDAKSVAAGRIYLLYTLGGGAVLLVGVVWVHLLAGPAEFTTGGALAHLASSNRAELVAIFVLLIGGLGVKAALVPFHGWLPTAMVAPAPVSALLHAVAVVKAGVYGIVRVVYDLFGLELTAELGLLTPLAVLASITILYGSLRALAEDELKKRLAFSTISQVSYIVLGTAIFGPLATIGGLVHLMHQGIMKVTLFFCAGNLSEALEVQNVSQMDGVGRRMPLTMAAFTIAAFGMIGVPPIAGFVSKWYLGLGGLTAGHPWVVGVLVASSLLNAAYFLPPIYAAWFRPPTQPWHERERTSLLEVRWTLLVPPVVTGLTSLAAGLFAGSAFSPLDLAGWITIEMYER